MTARILLADDQADIRKLIRLTLQHLDDTELHEAGNGGDAWRMARDLKPDLMMLDVMVHRQPHRPCGPPLFAPLRQA